MGIKHLIIIILFAVSTLNALGEKPGTLIVNALDNISSIQYHALFTTVSNNTSALNREYLRGFVANYRRPEFPVNLVFLTTPTENLPILEKTLHHAKIQIWYVVTASAQLENIAIDLQNSEIDGLLLLSEEPLPVILQALEDTKITLAQKKSILRLGCQIPVNAHEEAYQLFNTINLALLPTSATDPLVISRSLEPLLNYANELHTTVYIYPTNTTLLRQSTPAQLNKYISFLNSVLEQKKYSGLSLSSEDLEAIWENKKRN